MPRRVGFDAGARPVPVTEQATAARPGGRRGGGKGRWLRRVMPALFLVPMAGIGVAVLIRSMQSGQWFGAALAMVWCVVVISLGATRVIRAILPEPDHPDPTHPGTKHPEDDTFDP